MVNGSIPVTGPRDSQGELACPTERGWREPSIFCVLSWRPHVTPDSDGLLFQYGTYSFSGRPMFTVDVTRQFGISDDDGEHA
jgi:hypothetical protein